MSVSLVTLHGVIFQTKRIRFGSGWQATMFIDDHGDAPVHASAIDRHLTYRNVHASTKMVVVTCEKSSHMLAGMRSGQ